jgi:hypothetical protein
MSDVPKPSRWQLILKQIKHHQYRAQSNKSCSPTFFSESSPHSTNTSGTSRAWLRTLWMNTWPRVRSPSKTNGGFGRRTDFTLDATPVELLGVNGPGPESGVDSARDRTGETECGVIKLVSLARLSSIWAIRVLAACVAVVSVMAGSKTGEKGAKLEVGVAGALSEWSEPSKPNFPILTS